MTELTERARKLASNVEAIGLPNPDSSLRDCADTLRALCDENDQLRRCESCRFWDMHAPDSSHGGGERAGDDFASWGTCKRQNEPGRATPIFSLDASDYSSWIITRKEFSCSEWSER